MRYLYLLAFLHAFGTAQAEDAATNILERVNRLEGKVEAIEKKLPRPTTSKEVSIESIGGARGQGNVYQVRSGDTFESIAKKFRVPLGVLKGINPQLTDISKLDVGDLLFVPNSGAIPDVYTVRPGDTFNQIILSYGLDAKIVQKLNPTLEPDKIKPGQRIILLNAGSSSP